MSEQIQRTLQTWSKEHYILFMYVLMSLADNEIIYTEWDMMKDKITLLSPDIDYSVTFVDVTKVFQRCNDAEVLAIIDRYKTTFKPSLDEIDMILQNAEDIIGSDDHVRAEEKQSLLILRKALLA